MGAGESPAHRGAGWGLGAPREGGRRRGAGSGDGGAGRRGAGSWGWGRAGCRQWGVGARRVQAAGVGAVLTLGDHGAVLLQHRVPIQLLLRRVQQPPLLLPRVGHHCGVSIRPPSPPPSQPQMTPRWGVRAGEAGQGGSGPTPLLAGQTELRTPAGAVGRQGQASSSRPVPWAVCPQQKTRGLPTPLPLETLLGATLTGRLAEGGSDRRCSRTLGGIDAAVGDMHGRGSGLCPLCAQGSTLGLPPPHTLLAHGVPLPGPWGVPSSAPRVPSLGGALLGWENQW